MGVTKHCYKIRLATVKRERDTLEQRVRDLERQLDCGGVPTRCQSSDDIEGMCRYCVIRYAQS